MRGSASGNACGRAAAGYRETVRHSITAFAVTLIGLAACAGCGQTDVDRERDVAQNLRLLRTFPTPPGSSRISLDSERLKLKNEPFGGYYVASYTTFVSYRTPPSTTWEDVAHFYSSDVSGWRLNSRQTSSSGTRSACYRGVTASVCVRTFSNLDPGKNFGTVFQVSVAAGI